MAFEPKDMTGTLFVNDKKEKDTHPDRQGYLIVEGRKLWLSGWLKKKDGKDPFLSLSCKWADEQAEKIREAYEEASGPDDADDLPF